MSRILSIAAVVVAAIFTMAGCATDDPRYADPPPGSYSPFAEPDERGTDDQFRDEPEDTPEPQEQEDEPPPELN